MRTLNTNSKQKQQYSKFEVPGFRSGSVVKKFFALLYYCWAIYSMISMTITYVQGDFSGVVDVLALIGTELCILGVFLTPVLAIGFSNHYDWHGIKLFMIIMIPICVLGTFSIYIGTLFSESYMYSVNPELDPANAIVEETAESSLDSSLDSAIESALESAGTSAVSE